MIIKSKRIITENGIVDGYLVVENHKIKAIETADKQLTADIDESENLIIPGIFDTHNHGTLGYSMMKDTPDADKEIKGYLKGLASQGVTAIFPTCGTDIIKAVAQAAKVEQDGAKIVGIHSEGPFLNRVGEQGTDSGHPEVDLEVVKKMLEDSEGMLKLVALAPELPGSDEVIHYLVDNGVRVAFAHSNCNYEEAKAAFREGVSVSTHTANVMSGIHHRNMGGLGACLLDDNLWSEVICDGLHVSDEMLRIMFRIKSYHRFMMISDNVPMAGAPLGRYSAKSLGGDVNIDEEGFCRTDSGWLRGSTKPVIYGIAHLAKELKIPLEIILQMACLNPALCYNLADRKGSLKAGKDADFVIVDDDFKVRQTYSEGRKVYDHQVDTDLFNHSFLETYKIS